MKFKKTILITLLLLAIFTLSAVSAADNTTDESNLQENHCDEIQLGENANNDLSSSQDEIISAPDDGKFSTLQNKIDNAAPDSTIYLENNYTYNSAFTAEGITISKPLTIDGKGHTIDGNEKARIFNVTNSNVIFKDIIFVNGYTQDYSGQGGAIYGECTAINCTFKYNHAVVGGAMYGGSAVNCTFIHNIAQYGGAMKEGSAVNCTFTDNLAWQQGGAMYYHVSAENCTFDSNTAKKQGGAISQGSAMNCTFINNQAENTGGAMYESSAAKCTFDSNHAASYGGAMYDCDAVGCYFNNNTAGGDGGAISGVFSYAVNCIFTKNHAYRGGAMDANYTLNCTFDSNTASFGGALYYTSAINCTFTNNKATSDGGAINGYEQNATDCRFINNTAKNGGATNGIPANNCNFTNNTATEYGGAMYKGSANNCIFNGNKAGISGDNTCNTTLPKAILRVSDFASTYNSGDRLLFEFTTESGTPISNANITIRVYRNNALIGTYYALSGEGWIVDIDAGSYIAVCSVENEAYDVDSANATLSISKADSSLSLTEIVFNVGGSGKSIATTIGATNITASVVDHSEATVTINNNEITVSGLEVGDYTLKVTTKPDTNHNPVSNTTTVTVNKGDSAVTVTPVTFDYESYGTATATLTGASTLTAYVVDHNEATVTVNGNKITVSGLNAGNYILNVTTIPDKHYTAVSNTTTITVNKINSSVSLTEIVFNVGDSGKSIATTIGATNITAYVVNHSEAIVTVNGNEITVSGLEVGDYTLKVTTKPDSNHNPVSNTTTVTVNIGNSAVSLTPAVFDYGSYGTTTATLTSASTVIAYVVGHSEAIVIVKNNTITISGLNAGNYILNVTTIPDKHYTAVSNTTTVTVNPVQTKITADAVTTTYNIDKYLIVTLKDINQNPVSGIKISVDLNGVKYYTTDKNGQIKVNVGKLVPKTYTAKITFSNSNYRTSSAEAKVTVKKAKPAIVAKKKTFKKAKKVKKYSITLKSGKTPIKNAKVTIKIKKKTYTAKTNAKGKATFKIKKLIKKGTYKATVTFKGNAYYNKATKKVNIKVK